MNRSIALLLAVLGAALVPSHVIPVASGAALTGSSTVKIRFLACTDFLAPPPACISTEFNGDTIETTGSGVFELDANGDGDVKGSGTFIHRNPTGAVVGQGTWKAKRFLAYRTYGCAGCEGLGLPAGSEGGSLLFRAELETAGGDSFDATIEINCALGNAPPNRLYDGVEVRVLGLRFDQAQVGSTLFIRK